MVPRGSKAAHIQQDLDEDEDLVGDMLTFEPAAKSQSPTQEDESPKDLAVDSTSTSPSNIDKLRDAVSSVQQLHRITVRVDDASFKHIHSIVRSRRSVPPPLDIRL